MIDERDLSLTMDPLAVAVCRLKYAQYPVVAPFHPAEAYPECGDMPHLSESNHVYPAVRECFRLAGLDKDRYGTPQWNPLKELIRPGETVLLKPNFVKESHPTDPNGWQYVITHGSIIRAVADYVFKALSGTGSVIVADGPQTDSSFQKISELTGLSKLAEFYAALGYDFKIFDLRKEEWESRKGVVVARRPRDGDPFGYVAFDLKECSEFVSHAGGGHYYGADYDSDEVNYHHTGGRHEYLIAGVAVNADVIFSLPKLKTHKKAGVTASLKNLVGINGDKNWLPHHTEGKPEQGGDERPVVAFKSGAERNLVAVFRKLSLRVPVVGPLIHMLARKIGEQLFGGGEKIVRSGNWWGNDTVWRMCLDLNKIALYGMNDGTLGKNVRRHYSLIDGIIAGEGSGPLNPSPKPAGLICFGVNPASVDAVGAVLMDFDPYKIPIIRQAFLCKTFPIIRGSLADVYILSNDPSLSGPILRATVPPQLRFKPHFGWVGHIEKIVSGNKAE